MQWAKAVIFTEKGVVALKDCNPKFDELAEYFKAYDSRDVTIGKGILKYIIQVSLFWDNIMTFIDSILHSSTEEEETLRTVRASA